MSINLLPEELRLAGKKTEKKSLLLTVGILYFLFFLTTNGWLLLQVNKMEAQYHEWKTIQSELDTSFELIEQLEQEIKLAKEEQEILEGILLKDKKQVKILLALQQYLPQNIRLRQIMLDEEGWGEFLGEANSMEQVGQLVDSLEQLEIFQAVHLSSLDLAGADGSNIFRLQLLLHN